MANDTTTTNTTNDPPSADEPAASAYTPNPADDMRLANAGTVFLTQLNQAEFERMHFWRSFEEAQKQTVITKSPPRTHVKRRDANG